MSGSRGRSHRRPSAAQRLADHLANEERAAYEKQAFEDDCRQQVENLRPLLKGAIGYLTADDLISAINYGWTRDRYSAADVVSLIEQITKKDTEALDAINLLLSAPMWPGACGMEDVRDIVRATGREEIPNAPEWERH